jgi:hypothetical protein
VEQGAVEAGDGGLLAPVLRIAGGEHTSHLAYEGISCP